MIAFQSIPFPTSDMNPWVWFTGAAAIAIGVLFLRYDGARERVITRCQSREDRLIEDNRTCLSSTKDLLTAVTKATDVAEGAVALHRNTDSKIDQNRSAVEDVKRISTDIQRSIDEMRRGR